MTLARVACELEADWYRSNERPAVTTLLLDTPGALECRLVEYTQQQFMMELRGVELQLRLPLAVPAGQRIRLFHRGWIRRGLLTRGKGAGVIQQVAQRICADSALQDAIKQIDFTRCELFGEGSSVLLRMKLYGGCELRSRLPSMRRYVPLGAPQARALRQAAYAIAAQSVVR